MLSYALNAHSPWEGYRVAINGTRGRVELDVVERGAVPPGADGRIAVDPSLAGGDAPYGPRPDRDRLLLQRHWQAAEEIAIPPEGGGHGGGDERILRDVFRGAEHDPLGRAAGYRSGLRSIAVGIAGNRPLAPGEVVRIDDLDVSVD